MIKSFLRGFFASFLLLSMTASASAQTKTWGHSLYQGVGLSNKLNDEDKQTVALRIGYAVSYTIAPRWAVTQGVALRLKGFGKDSYFAGNCSSTYIDLPLLLQYHFNKEWKYTPPYHSVSDLSLWGQPLTWDNVFCKEFDLRCNLIHGQKPCMKFLFVRSNVCRRLSSDFTSR